MLYMYCISNLVYVFKPILLIITDCDVTTDFKQQLYHLLDMGMLFTLNGCSFWRMFVNSHQLIIRNKLSFYKSVLMLTVSAYWKSQSLIKGIKWLKQFQYDIIFISLLPSLYALGLYFPHFRVLLSFWELLSYFYQCILLRVIRLYLHDLFTLTYM